jgi:XTP/dITP diphosphohydrolase
VSQTLHPNLVPNLVIATRNPGKAKEIRTILGEVPWILLSLEDFSHVADAPEDEDSFEGNALAKGNFYAKATGHWVLSDDSGLEVEALGGAPGVHSARYAGPEAKDADRRAKLLHELHSLSGADRRARFVCVCTIVTSDLRIFAVTKGICSGSIVQEERGVSGFGYDPIFKPDGFDETFGQLPDEVKNRISHRGKALLEVRKLLMNSRSA